MAFVGIFQYPAKRYLLCPAAFSVRLMKKFIRMKFGLHPQYEVCTYRTYQLNNLDLENSLVHFPHKAWIKKKIVFNFACRE